MVKSQRGAILVIALLIVSIITALAIDFSSRFQLSIGRAENRLSSSRIQHCVFTIEAFANWALLDDRKNNEYDDYSEYWADPNNVSDVENGAQETCQVDSVSVVLEDAQSRFNLNLLANRKANELIDAGKPFETRYNESEKRFIRLLQAVEENLVTTAEAEDITEAVVDWLDENESVSGDGGAESDFYLSQDKPYRAANQAFVSVTELRLISGVTDAIYSALKDFVVALPDKTMGININTAPIEVMRVLNLAEEPVPLVLADAQILESSRPLKKDGVPDNALLPAGQGGQSKEGFDDVQKFLGSSDFSQVFGSTVGATNLPPEEGLTTATEYFLLTAEVEIDKVIRRSYSMLRRKEELKTKVFRMHTVRRGSENVF